MRRRKAKRPIIPTIYVDWTSEMFGIFGAVPGDWTPPAKVKISAGRAHHTCSARFRMPLGTITTVRVRIERRDGQNVITDQSFTQRFRAGPRA